MNWLMLSWLWLNCWLFSVNPHFAHQVAKVESGHKGAAVRYGRLGQSPFWGPMGIHSCFLKKWPIDNPFVNITVGVRALRGRDKRQVLKRYNPEATEAYLRTVLSPRFD